MMHTLQGVDQLVFYGFALLNKDRNVEECDATKAS